MSEGGAAFGEGEQPGDGGAAIFRGTNAVPGTSPHGETNSSREADEEAANLAQLLASCARGDGPPVVILFGFAGSGKSFMAFRLQEASDTTADPRVDVEGVVKQTNKIQPHWFKRGKNTVVIVDMPGERFRGAIRSGSRMAQNILTLMAAADGYVLVLEADKTLYWRDGDGGAEVGAAISDMIRLADTDWQLERLARETGSIANAVKAWTNMGPDDRLDVTNRPRRPSNKPVFLALSVADRLQQNLPTLEAENIEKGFAPDQFDIDPIDWTMRRRPALYSKLANSFRQFRIDFTTAFRDLPQHDSAGNVIDYNTRPVRPEIHGHSGVHSNFDWLIENAYRHRGGRLKWLLHKFGLTSAILNIWNRRYSPRDTRWAIWARQRWDPAFGKQVQENSSIRLRGLLSFLALFLIDGRPNTQAIANGPFPTRRIWKAALTGVAIGIATLLIALGTTHRSLPSAETRGAIPIELPNTTTTEAALRQEIPVLRDGVMDARLPPWDFIPASGMSSVTGTELRNQISTIVDAIRALGERSDFRAAPHLAIDPETKHTLKTYERQLNQLDGQVGSDRTESAAKDRLTGGQTVTLYHIGLLRLWIGDGKAAARSFSDVLKLISRTRASRSLSGVGLGLNDRMRLEGIETAALYGIGIASAQQDDWATALRNLRMALDAADKALDERPYRAVDPTIFAFQSACHIVPIDSARIRDDLIVSLQHLADNGDTSSKKALRTETAALWDARGVAGSPYLAATLQLFAASHDQPERVEELAMDQAVSAAPPPPGKSCTDTTTISMPRPENLAVPAEAARAQALARAVAQLDPIDGAPKIGFGGQQAAAMSMLIRLNVSRKYIANELQNGKLDLAQDSGAAPAPWRREIGQAIGSSMLAYANHKLTDAPAVSRHAYEEILRNADTIPQGVVNDAWTRLNIGTSFFTVATTCLISFAIGLWTFLLLRRLQATYKATFDPLHRRDRMKDS